MAVTLMDFTVGTKDFRAAMRSVLPHACRDAELPVINRLRMYVDTVAEMVTVAATDRFTAALALSSVWETREPVVGVVDLALVDAAKILAVFTAGKESRKDDAPEYKLRIELLERSRSTGPDSNEVSTVVLRVTDVSGLISGEVLEIPMQPPHDGFPDLPHVFANHLDRPAGVLDTFGVAGELVARLKVATTVYKDCPLILSTPSTERGPILARCGDSFLGLLTRVRMGEDELIRHKSTLAAWMRRLPEPSTAKFVDLDDIDLSQPSSMSVALQRQAAEIVITTQFGGAAQLQRRLNISPKVADALLSKLCGLGIVGYADEDNPDDARTVIVPPEELAEALERINPPAPEEGKP